MGSTLIHQARISGFSILAENIKSMPALVDQLMVDKNIA